MAEPEDEVRAVRRYQLRTQLENLENQLQNLPQQRTGARTTQIQQKQNAEQQIHQAEMQERNAQAEIDRLNEQHQRQLEAIDARRPQFEAQIETLQRQLERPDDRLDQPRRTLEQQLDSLSIQLGGLPSERASVEAQFLNQDQGPRQALANATNAKHEGERQLAQADAAYEAQMSSLEAQGEQLVQNISALQQQLAHMDEEAAESEEADGGVEAKLTEFEEKLESFSALEGAKREAVSSSGAQDLSAAYVNEAERHSKGATIWVVLLGLAVVLAGGLGALVIDLAHPAKKAAPSEIATSIAVQVLVVGLTLYVIRVAASQFRAHRHLEAVNRGKAAALDTFNRIVAGPSERDVRTAVAAVLAQAVFATERTGFIDPAAEGVTVAENILGPLMGRLGGGG